MPWRDPDAGAPYDLCAGRGLVFHTEDESMDTITVGADHRFQSHPDATKTANAGRTLAVTATYSLSEAGRQASLLGGGNGREAQEITVEVPANRLHLVSVDAAGVARLKLRPRNQSDEEQ